MSASRLLTRHLWSTPSRDPEEADGFWKLAHVRSVTLVRLFYVLSLVWMVQAMPTWPDLRASEAIDPLWPAEWLDLVGTRTAITAILAAYAVSSILVAAVPTWRLARIAYSLSLLQYLSILNGFGKIGHGFHGWVWVSAFLILLPRGRSWRADAGAAPRRSFLHVVMLCQMAVLFFYTLTGFWKLYYAVGALFGPGVSAFEVNGFAYIIGENLLATGRETLIGDVLVQNPIIGWALFNGTMYLEVASLLILFRPRLHRVWGLGLIMFHIGTQAAMGILFPANIVLLGLVLLASPLVPEEMDVKATILDLPGIRLATRLAGRLRSGRTSPSKLAPAVEHPASSDLTPDAVGSTSSTRA